MSMLLIVFPCAFVSSSLYILINSKSICFVVYPLTFISIAISVIENSFTICLVVLPFSFIFGTIRPKHCSLSMAHSSAPITFINSSSFVLILAFSDGHVFIESLVLLKSFRCFISFEILTLYLSSELHDSVLAPLNPSFN
jgi:hypothetical protein